MSVEMFNEDGHLYLQMMQGNIERMANNSANCKAWMVAIVAGLLAIGCSIEDLKGWLWLMLIPIAAFWYIDTQYLQLERMMRNREQDFINIVKGLKSGNTYEKALFNFKPMPSDKDIEELGIVKTTGMGVSWSVGYFYIPLMLIVLFIYFMLR